MSKANFTDLKERADAIYASYAANFAGKPRATRDVALIETLISDLGAIVDEARTLMNGDRNPAMLSFIETASENLERYQNERTAIRDAQANPHTVATAGLANRANRTFDVYRRHFAGQDRGTRDRMLLHEMVGELEEIQRRMQNLVEQGADGARRDLETVTQQLGMYRDEVTNIARAQTVGTQEEVANRLAQLANAQFALYRNHFAGKSRVSRRPALLERIIANLEEYQAEMLELRDDGYASEMNRNNIRIVDQNLELYRKELTEIRNARTETAVSDLAGALGGAANDIFKTYGEQFAGKDRRTRDLDLLSVLCDQLREIALQMREIADEIDLETNNNNLHIVEERWSTYEDEYRRIAEAKGIS